jgi:hypothetical protein
MLIGALVVFRSSIHPWPGVVGLARISLTTMELGLRPGSTSPGAPLGGMPARQLSLVLKAAFSAPGLMATSEKPSPSVWGYQPSLYSKSRMGWPEPASRRTWSPPLESRPRYWPAILRLA